MSDPGGPYDGLWYLTKLHLELSRQPTIEGHLWGKGVFWQQNRKHGTLEAFERFRKAQIAHEVAHGLLMQQALERFRPGPRFEALLAADEQTLDGRFRILAAELDDSISTTNTEEAAQRAAAAKGYGGGTLRLPVCQVPWGVREEPIEVTGRTLRFLTAHMPSFAGDEWSPW